MNGIIRNLKEHPNYPRTGMIATHLGVVRGTSLNGKEVTGLEVTFDEDVIGKIVSDTEKMSGIIHVIVKLSDVRRLKVGDEIMAVVVSGDTREHVFPALVAAVDRIKSEATAKKELF